MPVILYPERPFPADESERALLGPNAELVCRESASFADLPDSDCERAEGLVIFRHWLDADTFRRFPRLRAVVRGGVGYDRIDRAAAARHGVVVCNVPDYGTTEVADHAITLALALRRGLLLHQDVQRAEDAPWEVLRHPSIRRIGGQRFGIVGLGRIGTAVALRAKALGFSVRFFDPGLPSGAELAIGVERADSLAGLLDGTDVLSLHTPLTRRTRNLIGAAELARLAPQAVVVNTSRGPVLDIDALEDAMRSGHVSAAGLDVVPVEPPGPAPSSLLRTFRAREPWLDGRLIVTPHSAYWTPQAERDIRTKAAETIRDALANQPRNVIQPEDE